MYCVHTSLSFLVSVFRVAPAIRFHRFDALTTSLGLCAPLTIRPRVAQWNAFPHRPRTSYRDRAFEPQSCPRTSDFVAMSPQTSGSPIHVMTTSGNPLNHALVRASNYSYRTVSYIVRRCSARYTGPIVDWGVNPMEIVGFAFAAGREIPFPRRVSSCPKFCTGIRPLLSPPDTCNTGAYPETDYSSKFKSGHCKIVAGR